MKEFRLQTLPWNVVFGAGKLGSLPGELESLGFARALVLSTPEQESDAKRIADLLGDRAARTFAEARMHVPVEIAAKAAQAARDCSADCSVSIGGKLSGMGGEPSRVAGGRRGRHAAASSGPGRRGLRAGLGRPETRCLADGHRLPLLRPCDIRPTCLPELGSYHEAATAAGTN